MAAIAAIHAGRKGGEAHPHRHSLTRSVGVTDSLEIEGRIADVAQSTQRIANEDIGSATGAAVEGVGRE